MDFKKDGLYVIKNFLEPDFVSFIKDYFAIRINAGQSEMYDPQAIYSYSLYGDPLMETILQNSCEQISEILGIKLLPTYTYTRLYRKDDELKVHRDRESCEVSATVSLGFPEETEINPIYFSENSDGSNPHKVLLSPGDLCIYRGCDLYHWRPPIKQKWYLQGFLHFVNKNGDYSNFIYDERPYLGYPNTRKTIL